MPSNFQIGGNDLETSYVSKTYLMDRYPELANTFITAGAWIWGRNNTGQLGINDIIDRSSPIQTISGGTNWKQVDMSFFNGAGIKNDGSLWVWGRNNLFQLGDLSSIDKSSPVQTVAGGNNWKSISIASDSSSTASNMLSIKTDGTLWVWGTNDSGQIGDNTTIFRNSPVQTVAGGTNWKFGSCGYRTGFGIKTDGTLWGWGNNNFGQLGTNDITHRSSPVQTISGGTNWRIVSGGGRASFAIKTDGTLWGWGSGFAIGDNTTISKSSPVQTISGGSNWLKVSVSRNSDAVAAIKTDGTLWTWGTNSSGQLGDNTSILRSSPVQTIAGGTNWKDVKLGDFNLAIATALKTDGSLWLWGNNGNGSLGDNTSILRSSPVQTIAGGYNWKSIAGGSMAIRDDSADFGVGQL